MSNPSDDQKLFKLILSAITSENLRPQDYEVALRNFQNGEMVQIIEKILGALASTGGAGPKDERLVAKESNSEYKKSSAAKRMASRTDARSDASKTADQLFDDVKRRKISRDRLEIILNSLDRNFMDNVDRADTMRNLIGEFKNTSSQRQWQLFDSIVNGNYESDPYLDSISNSK